METSKVDRIIQILDLRFIDIVIKVAQWLEIAGLLDINHIVLDAEFSADRFVAKDGEFNDNRERV